MTIFEFRDYKGFIRAWIAARPKRGRGELGKLAKCLRVHSTMVSHILGGNSQLSLEQAIAVAEYLGLSELESDYLIELVQLERAGTPALRKKFEARIDLIQKRALQLKERLSTRERLISEEDKAIFYSSWHFSAIRLLATLGAIDSHEIRDKLNLSLKIINEAIEFLTRTGICERIPNGKIRSGQSQTHLGADSPFVWKHHQTWRLKAMERHFTLNDEEIMYTAPLTISRKDMARFRERIVNLISELKETVENTEPELVACLTVDWTQVVTGKDPR